MQTFMKAAVITSLMVGLVVAGVGHGRARQETDLYYRFAIGDEETPIPSGTVWLYSLAWGIWRNSSWQQL